MEDVWAQSLAAVWTSADFDALPTIFDPPGQPSGGTLGGYVRRLYSPAQSSRRGTGQVCTPIPPVDRGSQPVIGGTRRVEGAQQGTCVFILCHLDKKKSCRGCSPRQESRPPSSVGLVGGRGAVFVAVCLVPISTCLLGQGPSARGSQLDDFSLTSPEDGGRTMPH